MKQVSLGSLIYPGWRWSSPRRSSGATASGFGQAVGVLLVAIGVLAIWFPWLLPGLHVSAMPAM